MTDEIEQLLRNLHLKKIAASQEHRGQWVIVTREQTGGNSQYNGLQAAYHVTLAALQHLPDGRWAVSEWLPQS